MKKPIMFIGVGDMSKQLDMKSLQELYDKIASFDIIYKPHPDGEICSMDNKIEVMKDFIPCELLLNKCRMVVSVTSYVYAIATKLYIPCISCIELVKWNEKKDLLFWRKWIPDVCGSDWVLFPKSYRSLELMLTT